MLTDVEVCRTAGCANDWQEANFVLCWSQSLTISGHIFYSIIDEAQMCSGSR